MKRPGLENFRFLGKNANIWLQFFYHSIQFRNHSVTNGITETAKDLGKHMIHPMYLFSYNIMPFSSSIEQSLTSRMDRPIDYHRDQQYKISCDKLRDKKSPWKSEDSSGPISPVGKSRGNAPFHTQIRSMYIRTCSANGNVHVCIRVRFCYFIWI